MPLECTLVRGPAAAVHSEPEEISVDVADGTPGERLQKLLAVTRDAGTLSVAGLDVASLTVGRPPLVNGAILVDGGVSNGRTGAHGDTGPSVGLMLLTHSGPDAGAVFPLERGRYAIGRATGGLSFPDPGMSREHALLEVSATALRLTETSGVVHVDGKRARSTTLTSSSMVHCGNSGFSIHASAGGRPGLPPEAGRSVMEPLDVRRKASHRNRWATAIAALLPLLAGVGLAVATGMWMFLGFTAISGAGLLVPAISTRKDHKQFRIALERAVREDEQRRRRCAPSAAEIGVAARPGSDGSGSMSAPAPGCVSFSAAGEDPAAPSGTTGGMPVWLRLGTGRVESNVRVLPEDILFRPPALESAPVTLDPSLPTVTMLGPRRHVDGLVRFLIVQLASFPLASDIPVVLLGNADRLPLPVRFLDGFTLATDNTSALEAVRRLDAGLGGKLIILDHGFRAGEDYDVLAAAAKGASWQVIVHGRHTDGKPDNTIELDTSGVSARLHVNGLPLTFVPDVVSEATFDRMCRDLAGKGPRGGNGHHHIIPARCSLEELISTRTRSVTRRWASGPRNKSLEAILGRDASHPVTFDFHVDGPHLLVAGTTGSGKSELLRTLVATLALKYSPEHVVFVFIDFKGGSGLGPLTALPHCVGMFTDLASHELDRALASLRGEIRYREECLSAAGTADISAYQRSQPGAASPIPHLMVIVDEFRMLVDEAPAALSELMRIATIGRSLGIHLVMATQRPQGALTADIRANVTSSIALRVQSDGESMDIINSKGAAAIPVHCPGRAFLVRASGAPEEFQSACLEVARADSPGMAGETSLVRAALTALSTRQPHGPGAREPEIATDAGLATVVSAVRTAWSTTGARTPRRPIQLPLPSCIPWDADLNSLAAPQAREGHADSPLPHGSNLMIPLGVMDHPECQSVALLQWSPLADGPLAMIGSGSSGLPESFRAVSAALGSHPGNPHLYILDAVGMLGVADEPRQFGAAAGLHQLPLAVRVLERISQEMVQRRSAARSTQHSPMVLIVAGWCTWQSALRASQWAWAEDLFRDIVRDGTPLGVSVLICGERELVGSRFFAAVPNRAFFPTGSTEESRFHWPRMPAAQHVPGRAVVFGDIADGEPAVAQFRDAPAGGTWPYQSPVRPSEPPFRIRSLPRRLDRQLFELEVAGSAQLDPRHLWIGLGGDEARPVSMPLRPKGLSLVLGAPGTGKSSILSTLQILNPGVKWIRPRKGEQTGPFWTRVAEESLTGSLDPTSILLVDDADSLDAEARQALAGLMGNTAGIIMTASTSPAVHRRLPLIDEVQANGMGLVLAPRTPLDADVFGVRLSVDGQASPGRGVRICGQELLPFQAVFDQSQES